MGAPNAPDLCTRPSPVHSATLAKTLFSTPSHPRPAAPGKRGSGGRGVEAQWRGKETRKEHAQSIQGLGNGVAMLSSGQFRAARRLTAREDRRVTGRYWWVDGALKEVPLPAKYLSFPRTTLRVLGTAGSGLLGVGDTALWRKRGSRRAFHRILKADCLRADSPSKLGVPKPGRQPQAPRRWTSGDPGRGRAAGSPSSPRAVAEKIERLWKVWAGREGPAWHPCEAGRTFWVEMAAGLHHGVLYSLHGLGKIPPLSLSLLGPNFNSVKCRSLDDFQRPSRGYCAGTSLDPPSPCFPALLTLTYFFFFFFFGPGDIGVECAGKGFPGSGNVS